MQIIIEDIPVEVVRKNIKNLYLAVLPPDGRVRVSAPKRISVDKISAAVRTRISWIRRKQEKFANQPEPMRRQYVSGETLYLWGQQYVLQVEYSSRRNSMVLSGDRAILTVRQQSTPKQRERFVNEWYRSLLKTEVEAYLPRWEQITGLYCSEWQSKNMTTKWGTCNTGTRKIWLNLQLAQKPPECLEYVILHELAHLRVKNHGPDFTAILDRYMPDWKERRSRLNEFSVDYLPPED